MVKALEGKTNEEQLRSLCWFSLQAAYSFLMREAEGLVLISALWRL